MACGCRTSPCLLYTSEHDACGIGAIVSINGIKTHQTVSDALSIVENLEHRAGKDAEGKTGDGVGILLQISHKFFKKAVKPLGIELGDERDYGVGMFFFPQDELARNRAKTVSYTHLDAYRVPGHDEEFIDFHNIHVVFTKTAETADHYIEKFAHENGKKYNVTVATSDGVEQVIIRGQGCLLISAREFEKEIAAMEEMCIRDRY